MEEKLDLIDSFSLDYRFLSNTYQTQVIYEGIAFRNAEAAFQAQKCKDNSDKFKFMDLNAYKAQKLGQKVKRREDWEEVQDQIMYEVVKNKFSQHPELKEELLATGDAHLENGEHWNDTYWGKWNGVGANKLGEILMRLREEFRKGVIV